MKAPRHGRIAGTLRSRISEGVYDEKLPSEAELTDEFGVSRTTIRTALQTLMNEGLIRSESGIGYFVRDRQRYIYRPQDDMGPRPDNPRSDFFLESAEERNPSQDITVRAVPAPGYVARRLRVEEDEFVGLRKRVRSLDGAPYMINDSYYPWDLVRGTEVMAAADIPRGINRVLAEMGHAQVRAVDEIFVRMPEPDEVETLAILPGTPVAVHIVTGFTAADRPVRVVRNVLPGDRHMIVFERTDPGGDAS